MSDHEESQERLARANIDDAQQRAAMKVEDAAGIAEEKVTTEARRVAHELTSEVVGLRKEITTLQQIDEFKAKVHVISVIGAALVVLTFIYLVIVNQDQKDVLGEVRRGLETHRVRNEASHDCLAEKMAKLPSPEQRATSESLTRDFVQEFLGCVTAIAPTIVPPGVTPDIRPRSER